MRSVKRVFTPLAGSYLATRASPESITNFIPSIVRDVSATFVDTITFLFKLSDRTLSCSPGGSSPCSAKTSNPRAAGLLQILPMVRDISYAPGIKIRKFPSSVVFASFSNCSQALSHTAQSRERGGA